MPADLHQLALAGHLDQRAVFVPGLNPNPVPVECSPPGSASRFKLDHQLSALQDNFFCIACMPGIHHESSAHCQQAKSHDGRCVLQP